MKLRLVFDRWKELSLTPGWCSIAVPMSYCRNGHARGCDSLVIVGGGESGPACTLFGKNSDRPSGERHEVVFVPAADHPAGSTVRAQYIAVPQVPSTLAVTLSRGTWMWGCEMGANECGVVGGNEATHSAFIDETRNPGGLARIMQGRLVGQDLLRLALQRGRTARAAAGVLIGLLETYGQGGACSDGPDPLAEMTSGMGAESPPMACENSFLIADAAEAFVLETAGVRHWALVRLGPGARRNISNGLSITTEWDACDSTIRDVCRAKGWWDGTGRFDWQASLGERQSRGRKAGTLLPKPREAAGRAHLEALAADSSLDRNDGAAWCERMAAVLRDDRFSGSAPQAICMRDRNGAGRIGSDGDERRGGDWGFCSTGSMVSWITTSGAPPAPGQSAPAHLFTAASDPSSVTYKGCSFPAHAESKAGQSNRSAELWERWRHVERHGGLEAVAGSRAARQLRDELSSLEALSFRAAAAGRAVDFAAAVEREIGLLDRCVNRGAAAAKL